MLDLLVVTLADGSLSGGSVASRSNVQAFSDSGEYDLTVVGPRQLEYATIRFDSKTTGLQKIGCYARLRPSLNHASILRAIDTMDRASIDVIFLDSSLLGQLIPALRKRCPAAYVVTFFHNVEFAAYQSVMDRRSPSAWIRTGSVFRAEQAAAKLSDCRITLSSRDSDLLRHFFGAGADLVWPISYPAADATDYPPPLEEEYVLFVGGYYKPNLEAIEYLARRVAPHVQKKIVVAGARLGPLRAKHASSETMIVLDSPLNLAPLYRHANLVLAPVFSGGGLKTKIIEALSFGKFVVSSPAAAVGFEYVSRDCIRIAHCDRDYIDMINSSQRSPTRHEIVAEFDKYYSTRAKSNSLRQLTQRVRQLRAGGSVA